MKNETLTSRRRFLTGAALAAAPLAVAVPAAAKTDDAAARLRRLEDVHAIRALRDAYVRGVNTRAAAGVAALFADPAKAAHDATLRTLTADPAAEPETVEIAKDGASAILRAAVTAHTETPMEERGTLVDMLRAMGEAVVRREEKRTLELAFVKGEAGWKIASAKLA